MTAEEKQALIEAFREARKIQVGSRLIMGGHAWVEREKQKALRRGQEVVEGGTREWIEVRPLAIPGMAGSARYEWHQDGNRIRCEKLLHTKPAAGPLKTVRVGVCWKDYIAVVND